MTQALTVNDYEASVVEQRTGRSIEDIARDLTAVVVTRGAEGATRCIPKARRSRSRPCAARSWTPPAAAIRSAAVYSGLTCGWSWEDSCRLGNVMGALKIASRGPQNYAPSRAEIDAVLHATYGIHLPA